ncbi:MAG TPA: hypothetical protein PLR02_01960 [Rhodocyclaceae bacterium]|nr:hypothetical protein [Rhodocyclaceae bacterium]
MKIRRLILLVCLPLLAGCEMVYDLLEIPNPKKEAEIVDSEGRAIGSACRHAGRSLEDCYILNPKAEKASVFKGWRDMNDYMILNGMEVVPSRLTPTTAPPPEPRLDVPAVEPAAH